MSCLSSITEKESLNPLYDSTCLFDSGEIGQISPRLWHQECENLELDHRAEHPQHLLPSEQTEEFKRQSLCKVFTSNIDIPENPEPFEGFGLLTPSTGLSRRFGDTSSINLGQTYSFRMNLTAASSTTNNSIWLSTAGHNHGTATNWFATEHPHNSHESAFSLRTRHSPYIHRGNHDLFETGDILVPARFERHMDELSFYTLEKMFNKDPPRYECCFKPVFAPFGWYNEKTRLGEALNICSEIPSHRIASKWMGVPLDYCKKHFKIALDWHNDYFGMNPNMIKKFRDKDIAKLVEQRLERDRLNLERKTNELAINSRADELLKKWLSEAEYNYLQEHSEIEFPSQHEKDVIYIVKKNVSSKVIRKVNGVETEALCVMPLDGRLVNDDGLLSKILLLKTDEEEFLRLANHYPLIET